jgi:HCOMODA/2-hydroxy-3-carboxy-muconic semialdehyde decarboxylase
VETAPAAHPEQTLIDDVVLANWMFVRALGILDTAGHVSARSQLDPNHYFISRYVSPGAVTRADIIENDLDSRAVQGPRTDQVRETELHGEIYKARPDVMAIVHAHAPELVAFGMSSVPLWSGDTILPVFDIRPFNEGSAGTIQTPQLGRAMARALGNSESLLLWGHGVAVTSSSLHDLVPTTIELRTTARLQQAAVSMGGRWDPSARRASLGSGTARSTRTWDALRRAVLAEMGGQIPSSSLPVPARPADPNEAARLDLAYANRILASDELSTLDAYGHVSVRSPSNPTRFFVAPDVAAGVVTVEAIVERSLDDPGDQGLSVHADVYRAKPDVMAVLYADTPEVVAITERGVPLRPVVNGGSFLGDGFGVFDIGSLDPTQPILSNPMLGRGVAEALGDNSLVVLPRHGFVLTGSSLSSLLNNAYSLRENSVIQQMTMALRGEVAYLDDPAPPPDPAAEPREAPGPGPTFPEGETAGGGRGWVYWLQTTSLE